MNIGELSMRDENYTAFERVKSFADGYPDHDRLTREQLERISRRVIEEWNKATMNGDTATVEVSIYELSHLLMMADGYLWGRE